MPFSPTSKEPARETQVDFQVWLNRYAAPDGYSRWKQALRTNQKNAAFLAFAGIAGEEDLLQRLPSKDATRLVRDAQAYARESMGARVVSQGTAIATETVAIRIEVWRRAVERSRNGTDLSMPALVAGAEPEQAPVASPDLQALAAFPQILRSTAPHLIDTVLRLGCEGLLATPPPMNLVYALGAARVAARSGRGVHWPGKSVSRAEGLAAIDTVQRWSHANHSNPFTAAGHGGATGSLADRVTSLLMDASGCASLAARLPGGAGAPGFGMWERAEEALAYAFVSLRASRLEHMSYDTAVHFASAAGRMADRLMADPAQCLADLPSGWQHVKPATVAAMARSVTRGPFTPRRSALAQACVPEVKVAELAAPIPMAAGGEQTPSWFSRLYQPARRGVERWLG